MAAILHILHVTNMPYVLQMASSDGEWLLCFGNESGRKTILKHIIFRNVSRLEYVDKSSAI